MAATGGLCCLCPDTGPHLSKEGGLLIRKALYRLTTTCLQHDQVRGDCSGLTQEEFQGWTLDLGGVLSIRITAL